MKKYKTKIISGIVIIAALAFAFWWGGDAPSLRGWNVQKPSAVQTPEEAVSDIVVKGKNEEATAENKPQHKNSAPMTGAEKEAMAERIAEAEGETAVATAPPAIGAETEEMEENPEIPTPTEALEEISEQNRTCTLSVRCDTILQNMAWLNVEKTELVPSDGVIYAEREVVFYEGESVFNLLLREMKQNKIHMEFKNIPLYESAYIEGIHNIYEFDCGELSGWMYKVNGVFPGFGCSQYKLENGDKVEWVYTCDMGVDVGGHYAARNGRK